MTFNSWEFLLLYPIILLLWFTLPQKARMPMLLASSYFIYMYYQPSLVVLILFTTAVSYAASILMEKSDSTAKRRLLLALALTVSLGVLFFFKYFDFLVGSITGIFGKESPALNLMLPVGISFYTFQTLSYVIDVYRKNIKAERNFFYYALFVSYFPQLVAGPIERPENLLPQLRKKHVFNKHDAIIGAKFTLLGFFKKICVADLLAGYVNSIYNNPGEAGAFGTVLATVFFAIEIYCDFSGYTDIAIGVSRIMGIRLMKNFDKPYSSKTITEFWSRWHISLSSWLKDYLYIPLGGSRCKKWRHLLNLFIVFLASGLWHGAAWTFVLWGVYHGILRILSEISLKKRNALLLKKGFSPDSRLIGAVRTFNTFILVLFSWMIFRANSISELGMLLASLFDFNMGFSETLSAMGLGAVEILLVIFSLATLFIFDRLVVYGDENSSDTQIIKNGSFIFAVWCIGAVWLLLLSRDMLSSFIYFQF